MARKELNNAVTNDSQKMTAKDLMYGGAFAAIYIVLMLIVVMGSGIVPILYVLSGKTVVVSEHRIFYLLGLADRFLYMDDGRITGTYQTEEVLNFSDETLEEKGLRLPDLNRLNKIGKAYKKMQIRLRS